MHGGTARKAPPNHRSACFVRGTMAINQDGETLKSTKQRRARDCLRSMMLNRLSFVVCERTGTRHVTGNISSA